MKRKNITTSIRIDLIKALKHLAVDRDKPLNELFEEAIENLLKECEKPTFSSLQIDLEGINPSGRVKRVVKKGKRKRIVTFEKRETVKVAMADCQNPISYN